MIGTRKLMVLQYIYMSTFLSNVNIIDNTHYLNEFFHFQNEIENATVLVVGSDCDIYMPYYKLTPC